MHVHFIFYSMPIFVFDGLSCRFRENCVLTINQIEIGGGKVELSITTKADSKIAL